jgi:hypothetical protein
LPGSDQFFIFTCAKLSYFFEESFATPGIRTRWLERDAVGHVGPVSNTVKFADQAGHPRLRQSGSGRWIGLDVRLRRYAAWKCSLDGAPLEPCTAVTVRDLAAGDHTFALVQVVDGVEAMP